MGLCAVKDCEVEGKPQVCLWDGRLHGHGRIHYDCAVAREEAKKAGLQFREGDWHLMCDEHYAALKAASSHYARLQAEREAGTT